MCLVIVSKKKKEIEIFHINFENIFSPKICSDRLLDGSNARRTRGVFTWPPCNCPFHKSGAWYLDSLSEELGHTLKQNLLPSLSFHLFIHLHSTILFSFYVSLFLYLSIHFYPYIFFFFFFLTLSLPSFSRNYINYTVKIQNKFSYLTSLKNPQRIHIWK